MKKLAALAGIVVASAGALAAETKKEVSCRHQADVVAAVQKARVDDVSQDAVADRVASAAIWPEKFNALIPIVTPWIYGLSASELRENDYAKAWNEGCLKQ